jgi:hypothetical protein
LLVWPLAEQSEVKDPRPARQLKFHNFRRQFSFGYEMSVLSKNMFGKMKTACDKLLLLPFAKSNMVLSGGQRTLCT